MSWFCHQDLALVAEAKAAAGGLASVSDYIAGPNRDCHVVSCLSK